MQEGLPSVLFSIAVIAALALAAGGIRLIRRNEGKGWLMVVAALVLLGNVLIWTWPLQ